MINFTQLKVQNFFSVGNNPIEINLKNANLTLVCGKNGSGKCLEKSSLIEIDTDEDTLKLIESL